MKVKLKKSLTILLAITLVLSISNTASAQTHVPVTFLYTTYVYSDYDSNMHKIIKLDNYSCSCGGGIAFSSTSYASHIYTSGFSYTGYNYHSGTRHYFEFAKYCISCRHKDAYFDPKTCSGPPCTIPY